MADFKRRQFGKEKNFGKRSRDEGGFGRRDRSFGDSEKKMHRVICAKCSKSCEVPFKPTNNKPVYCSDCFRKNEKSSRNSRFDDDDDHFDNVPQRSNDDVKKQLQDINEKLDRIIEALDL